MPVTPFHFGPSGFIGLVFRRWIDLPVIVLANVLVDVEVLFANDWPHRVWHFHTLLIGALLGAAWGLAAYPFRPIFKRILDWIRIPYQPTLIKMIISGILGVWLHVFLDGIYHYDVQIFWPFQKHNPLWNLKLLTQGQVKILCTGFWLIAIALYGIILMRSIKKENRNLIQAEKPK